MARSPRWQHISIPLPDDGLKMAIVADTHSKPHPDAYRLITERRPHHILHGGDIGDLSLDDLAKLAPLTAVRGNIDETTCIQTLSAFTSLVGHLFMLALDPYCSQGSKAHEAGVRDGQIEERSLVVCGHHAFTRHGSRYRSL